MTKLSSLWILRLLGFACSPSDDDSRLEYSLTYTVDTLRIDAGSHLFYLAHGLPAAKLSPDEKYLYFYDGYMHSIDQVDLEEEKYNSTIQLESEGPKGVLTQLAMDYIPKENENLFFFTQRNFIELDPQGNLVYESPSLDSMFKVGSAKQFYNWAKLSPDLNFLFGLASTWKQEQMLGWVDLQDSSYNELSLDSMSYRDDLKVSLKGGVATLSSAISSRYFDNKIIVYHADGIDLYVIDPFTKTQKFVDNYPKLTDRRKPGNFPKTGEFMEVEEFRSLEIYYQPLVFDQVNRRYYRLATKVKENQTVNNPSRNKYLSIFDENLQLIYEEDISSLDFQYPTYFAREGKLYFYQNQNDEMEFLIFDLKLESKRD
jgi:hypothetical protein